MKGAVNIANGIKTRFDDFRTKIYDPNKEIAPFPPELSASTRKGQQPQDHICCCYSSLCAVNKELGLVLLRGESD